MPIRTKSRALFYGRRSTSQQEHSLESQIDWAIRAASAEGVPLNVSRELLAEAQAAGDSRRGDLFIDDSLSGSKSERQGIKELISVALRDRTVSHIFVHKRDRLARPSNPAEAAAQETRLVQAGITIVFSDKRASPTKDGSTDIAHAVTSLIDYHLSGEFLQVLSKRIIDTQRLLAERGFSTGGCAPYGFARYLKSPDGEVTYLPDGRRVRQEGHHVVHLPHDREKLATWIMILELKEQGYGAKRIANELNRRGIPSPGAGRKRTDNGTEHFVSGKWNHTTVMSLCKNPIIIGVLQHGVRSEGKHYRWTKDGNRPLLEDERDGDSVRRVTNPVEERIETKADFEPEFSPERFEAIQKQMQKRGKSQRGIRRAKDPSKYPLATRVVDLTADCGSIMYAKTTKGQQARRPIDMVLYVCGRHLKTSECSHNSVKGDPLLKVVLRSIKHLIRSSGTRSQLAEKLHAIARARSGDRSQSPNPREILEKQRDALEKDCQEIARKLAVETNEQLSTTFREMFTEKERELKSVRDKLNALTSEPEAAPEPPEVQVEKAFHLLDNLEKIVELPEAKDRIHQLLEKLDIWIGLDFTKVPWGKRTVNRVKSGMITLGGYHLPVPLHGRENCGKNQSAGDCGRSAGLTEAATQSDENPGDLVAVSVEKPAKVDEEGDSYTKVSRGD